MYAVVVVPVLVLRLIVIDLLLCRYFLPKSRHLT